MARRRSSFVFRQRLFVWGLAAVMLGALGYFSWLTLRDQPLGDFAEGEHYRLAARPVRVRGDQVDVIEFFSYGCIHCYNFDDDLDAWVAAQGEAINFSRQPLIGSQYWRLLGQAWLTMQALELDERWHKGLFRAIHDGRQPLNTPARLQAYFAEAGVAAADFQRVFNSPEVRGQAARADQLARRLQVASVPTVVVDGRYLVGASPQTGLRRMLEVMSHLVQKTQQERASGQAAADQEPPG